MPQLVLDYSNNVIEKKNIVNLLEKFHSTIAEMLPTNITSCKSRVIENHVYCVGDGNAKNAFVHVSLKIMPGRTEETVKNLGEHLIELMMEHFSETQKNGQLQLTVEISELDKHYFKVVS